MEKFSYKQAFLNQEVDVSKEMVLYKGKNIPASSIKGIGISFVNVTKVVIGQALGGILGNVMAQRGFNGDLTVNKDLVQMPDSAFGQVIITSSDDGQKQKVLRIPINTKEETCKKLIQSLAKNFPEKFIGFGSQPAVEKALNISQKAVYIFVALLVVGITAYVIFSLLGYQP